MKKYEKNESDLGGWEQENIYRRFHAATQYIPWQKWVRSHPLPKNVDEYQKTQRFEAYLEANQAPKA